jgi:chromate reductase
MKMKKIIALGGSNSKNSINKKLAIYAADKIKNAEITVVDLNDFKLPVYGVDLVESGIPTNATRLNELIESVDGLIISLAEHNGSYTVAFKNAIDWLSTVDSKVWKNKPMLLMATTPVAEGGAETVLQLAKKLFPYLGGNIIADFLLPSFGSNFSEQKLTNEKLNVILNEKINLFQKAI